MKVTKSGRGFEQIWIDIFFLTRYAPSADSAHTENRIKNKELDEVLGQYPSKEETVGENIITIVFQ